MSERKFPEEMKRDLEQVLFTRMTELDKAGEKMTVDAMKSTVLSWLAEQNIPDPGIPVYQNGEFIGNARYTGFSITSTKEEIANGKISASFEYRIKGAEDVD